MYDKQKVYGIINYLCSYFFLLFVYILTYYSMLFVGVQGLGIAVDVILPHAERHFCVQHLHATRKASKDELWGVTWTSNIYAFKDHMQNVLSMDKGAHAYLSGISKWHRGPNTLSATKLKAICY